jgi:hypothetical protein
MYSPAPSGIYKSVYNHLYTDIPRAHQKDYMLFPVSHQAAFYKASGEPNNLLQRQQPEEQSVSQINTSVKR